MRKRTRKLSKALSLLLCLSLLGGSILFPAAPARAEGADILVDDFDFDVTIADEVTGTFEKWPAGNVNTGTTIWGNAADTAGCTLTYEAEEGKCFEELTLTLEYFNGFEGTLAYVLMEAKTKDGAGWETLAPETGAASALNDSFQQVEMTAQLPSETVQVRISITQPTSYTLWLDRLELSIADLPADPDPDPGPDPDPTPEAEPEENQSTDSLLVDNFVKTVTVAGEITGNFERFNPHPDTGTGVWGNANGAAGSSVVYAAPAGKRFQSLALTVDYFDGYVNAGGSLKAEALVSGGEEWTQVALTAGAPELLATTSAGQAINRQTFTASLPENTVSVRVTMLNDVAWTLFLDRLELPIAELPTEPDPGPDPGETTDHGTYTETRTKFTFNDREFDYSLAQPKESEPKTAILYLHGLGGDTDFTIYENFLKAVYDTYEGNCIVVAPFAKAAENDYWIDYAAVYENLIEGRCSTYTQGNYTQTAAEQFALSLFQDVCQQYTLDKKYIVGYSMGAYGTWDIITRSPGLFDAAVPISGGSDPSLASKLTALPIWAFHGNADAVVDYHGTLNMVEAIRALEGKKLRYTEYENGDHGICYLAFAEALPWLFQGAPDPEPGTDPDPTPEAEPEENQSTDSLLVDNFVKTVTVAGEITGNFERFNPHPDTGTGVWGNANGAAGSSVVYAAPAEKRFQSLALTVDYFDGYVNAGGSLKAEALVSGGEEWTQVTLTAGAPELLATTSAGQTVNRQTFTADLPENTVSVRVTMLNDVAWTLFLDRLELPIAELEQEAAPRPGAAAESPLVDDFLPVGKASETVGNLSQFDPHPDTGTSVWGQAENYSQSSLIYRVAEEETYFRDLALTVNYFDGYLQPASSLRVEVRKDGDTSWSAVSLNGGPSSHLATTAGGLEVKMMTFSAQLPWGSKEVKITLLNDVAWTLFLDRLEMNLGETSREIPFEGLKIEDLANAREGTFEWGTIPTEGGAIRTAVCTEGEDGEGALIYHVGNDRDSIVDVVLRTYCSDTADPAEIFTVLAQTKGSTTFQKVPAAAEAGNRFRSVTASDLKPGELNYAMPKNTISVKVIVPVAREEAEDAAYLTGISLTMSEQTQTQPSNGSSSSSSQGKGNSAVKEQEKEAVGWTGESLTDEFTQDKQVATEVLGEFSQFDPHPDTGTSVWGLTNNYTQGSLIYRAQEGRVFNDISLTVNYFVGYVDLTTALTVEVQGDDGTTWYPVALEARGEKLLNTTPAGLEVNTLTYGARLPKGAAKLKINMLNDVAWTVFLDRLELNTVEPSEQADAPAPEEPLPSEDNLPAEETTEPGANLPTTPESAASTVGVMKDELADFSKVAAHTENLQLFEVHPETGGSVIGRLDTSSESSITYAAPEGAYIQALLLGVQYYPEFVDFDRDISVTVQQEGKTNWKKVSFTAGQARDIPGFESGAFKNNELTVYIPDRVVKVRIEFLNDVAWTVFLDRVTLTTGVEEKVPASLKAEPAKPLVGKAAGTSAKAPAETAPAETTEEPPAETLTESLEKTPAEVPTEAPTEAPQDPTEAVEEIPAEEVPLAPGVEWWQNNVLWWAAALVVLAASGALVYMNGRKKHSES